MKIRDSVEDDVPALVALFQASVHRIGARFYTPDQLAAWAPPSPDVGQWRSRLAVLHTLVAEHQDRLAGFIAYSGTGHIDLLYTSPAFERQGVALRLYQAAEQRLREQGVTGYSTEASLAARPFFEGQGFRVVEAQTVERNGVVLSRFVMTKDCPGH